ncbi:methionine ABC transporter ATP-binding protein [Desulfitobacterium sp. Sab5]|uniref:methionine ABC transporter ATP-binding protein n=1 Tax=Desulfitobacterium nosdiversum TaxID=3375356 RepID=UPI003CEAA02E
MIRLQNISKSFTTEESVIHAVKGVNLEINKGEVFGIIGFSGAGKSTLVRCINLLERPTEGSVTIDGMEITTLSEKELRTVRKKIGMIFQHFNLMKSRTVYQNVAYPLKGRGLTKTQIQNKVKSLLKLVNLSDKETAYPSQLSGGQKQRVAIARALANEPKVLLCDEATSALDPQTTLSILKLLKELNEKLGLTIVIITHEMSVIKEVCNRVAVMDKGSVIEQGDVFSVFSSPKEAVTQEFIDTTSTLSKIYDLIKANSVIVKLKPGEKIIKLKYLEKSTSEPLVSFISRQFNIDLNIIFGNIEIIQEAPLGGLVALVSGKEDDIKAAIQYLLNKNVEVEVINDGIYQ